MIHARETTSGRWALVDESGAELSSFATEEAATAFAPLLERVCLNVTLGGFTLTTTEQEN